MGSWDETCAISNLPITEGDRARVIALSPGPKTIRYEMADRDEEDFNEINSGFCYPSDIWQPFSLAILTTYEDYGNFKLVSKKDPSFEHFFNKSEATNTKALLANLFKGKLKGKTFLNKSCNLGFCAIREDIFQKIINLKFEELPFADRTNLEAEAIKWINELKQNYKTKKILDTYNIRYTNMFLRTLNFPDNPHCLRSVELYIQEKFESLSEASIITLVKDMIDMLQLNYFMMLTRKFFSPQAGKGSQTLGLKEHKMLAKSVLEIIKNIEDKYDYSVE